MIKTVYLATPDIAVSALEYLINKSDIEVCALVTMPDRPAGRGNKMHEPPVKTLALKYNIPIYQTASISKDKELLETIKNIGADFFVTFAFGQLLSQEVLDIPKNCTVNLHASLLPEFRGANPIQQAIINGKKYTGITTMKTVLKMDAGDICLTDKIDIEENMTVPELVNEISSKAPELIYKTLLGLNDNSITPIAQDEEKATFAPKFKKEDGIVDFNLSAVEFHNKVRGLQPWPNAYICRDCKNTQILQTEVSQTDDENAKPGEILCINKDGITVKCSSGSVTIKTLKPESKGLMKACDFANGKRLKKGDML